ncbi:MAG: hypothetical protein QOJ29_1751 [Thermoleophilaceae bacterium]|jgi:hypothetical protein|nr:hypothetical protein [Thermoleophilaceae bacterium]
MLITENDRLVIACNYCPVRLDLGPKQAVEHRNRMPSMWQSIGDNCHVCPNCAPLHGPRFTTHGARGELLVS